MVSISSISFKLWFINSNFWWISPCTSAWRINISPDSSGFIDPYAILRLLTMISPNKDTCSFATTSPLFFSQWGSEYVWVHRSFPICSSHSGSIFATLLAKSWLVFTNSAATIQFPALLKSPEPGNIIACWPLAALKIFFSFLWAILARYPYKRHWCSAIYKGPPISNALSFIPLVPTWAESVLSPLIPCSFKILIICLWISLHSLKRLKERKCSWQYFLSFDLVFNFFSAFLYAFQIFKSVIKSEAGSLNNACFWSAAWAFSAGRCLGSAMARAVVITHACLKHPFLSASIRILDNFGSMGSFAITLPILVRIYFLWLFFTAPISTRVAKPSLMLLGAGLSINGKVETSPRFKEIILNITSARLLLKISGEVKKGLAANSSSSNNLMQIPFSILPHLPSLWFAEDWEIGLTGSAVVLVLGE